MSATILKVSEINKSFDDLKAVDNISFEVYQGEILGLLGPNGAGKTTAIRMIMGIFQPDSGTIEFDRDSIINKKKIGYLPEERGIYDDTKVMETLLYFAELKGMDKDDARKKAVDWLERVQLSDFADSKIEELSKGMQQKIQFIMSVIHKPEMLVLDEVFSGLDPVNQNLFKDIIKDLAADGMTILLSSHRMNMVEELCDRIFMINKGKRVLYGKIDQIKDEYGIKLVKIRSREEISNANSLKVNSSISEVKVDGNSLSFRIKGYISPAGILELVPDEIEIDEISIAKPPLHDIFVATIDEEVSE
ncbi:MAG: ABC transporter ATP-binding protein [Halanaerobiales bacterium]